MRKNVFGRQFGRDSGERTALFKGLATSLVLHERIQTTEEKAKAVRGHIEKLVTKAKGADQRASRLIEPYLSSDAVAIMIKEVGPRFKNRPGGYTRIIRMGRRLQDNAMMVILEWVEKRPVVVTPKATKKTLQSTDEKAEKKEKVTSKKEATLKAKVSEKVLKSKGKKKEEKK